MTYFFHISLYIYYVGQNIKRDKKKYVIQYPISYHFSITLLPYQEKTKQIKRKKESFSIYLS